MTYAKININCAISYNYMKYEVSVNKVSYYKTSYKDIFKEIIDIAIDKAFTTIA